MTVRAVRGAVRLDRGVVGREAGRGGELVPRPLTGIPERGVPAAGGPDGARPTAAFGPRGGFPAAQRRGVAR
ncbi:hypothetical protein IQ279_11295 [Streptomyces verrucosisporus]|uniref:hypothetical protein n=1 Tax=Streptomyces verrucosisporus TaxID=1695161 RepID=UPI0019D10E7D|nr:hypothetical protein [Streptomyces verrucosisporus]MBN3930211.1 hypothetical protein [Streptomyces verrucosisporus]